MGKERERESTYLDTMSKCVSSTPSSPVWSSARAWGSPDGFYRGGCGYHRWAAPVCHFPGLSSHARML
ncbi:hypothetical protein RSAG8_08134, partial [Rhizoctonia solani AG-8 WAC10335]